MIDGESEGGYCARCVQEDEVNQDSKQDEVDGMKKGAEQNKINDFGHEIQTLETKNSCSDWLTVERNDTIDVTH